jgi:S1-C subfamily serine protease
MRRLLLIFLIGWGTIQAPPAGWLGITVQELTPQMAARFGVHGQEGALVARVEFGSPAQKAGLLQGDIIISLNDRKIIDIETLRKEISKISPDTPAQLTIIRDRKTQKIEINVGAPPREVT